MWYSYVWGTIHCIALRYPDDPLDHHKVEFRTFIHALGYVLPCGVCARHYLNYLKDNAIDLTNKHTVFKWTVDLHNHINKLTGKEEMSFEDAWNLWFNYMPCK